jgi:rhamnose transport system permease protein
VRREASVSIAWAALLFVLAFAAPGFFSPANLRDLLLANLSTLLAASGMTLVILAGEIDISIGSMFAVLAVIAGISARAGIPMPLAALSAAAAGALLGALNGALVAAIRIPSIVVTLATMILWRNALNWATGGAWIENLPSGFQWFGLGQTAGEVLVLSLAASVVAALGWLLKHVAAARAVYATGASAESARLAGIPVRRVVFWVFAGMGAMTGFAAVLDAVRFREVQSNSGAGLELKAIAAVVVGGASITGGRGTLLGTGLGVGLLASVGPALTFLHVSPYWEKAIQGAIILASVVIDFARRTEARNNG